MLHDAIAVRFCSLSAALPVRSRAAPPDFNTHVAPIFSKYCTGCHNAEDAEGELVLESYEQLLAGGERGAAIVPGKSEQSRLVLLLDGQAKPAMPPEGNEAAQADEIALIKAWIDAGAKGPTGAAPIRRCWSRPRSPLQVAAAAADQRRRLVARRQADRRWPATATCG